VAEFLGETRPKPDGGGRTEDIKYTGS